MSNPPYIGVFEVHYPEGVVFRSEVADTDTMRWTGLEGPMRGLSGVEQTDRRESRPDVYFVSWSEPDGTVIAQVADYTKMRVTTCMVTAAGRVVLEGQLRRIDSPAG